MKALFALCAAALCLSPVLGGCASTLDPEEICTAEWIAPRAARASDRIEDKTARAFRALRKVGGQWVSGDKPGPLALLSLRNALDDLEAELKNGRGVRDLRLLARTCDDPQLIRSEITRLMERQDLPEPVLDFMRGSPLLDRLVEWAEGKPDAT